MLRFRLNEQGELVGDIRRTDVSVVDVEVVFSPDEAPGALRNGTRVQKVNTVAGDTHYDGALATVRGSIGPALGTFGYWVVWDDMPGLPVFIAGERLEDLAGPGRARA